MYSSVRRHIHFLNAIKNAFAFVLDLPMLFKTENSPQFKVIMLMLDMGLHYKAKHRYIFVDDHRNFESSF